MFFWIVLENLENRSISLIFSFKFEVLILIFGSNIGLNMECNTLLNS